MDTERYSFEFFPPKTEKGFDNLHKAFDRLQAVAPDFYSMTYGAGGSTRDRTKQSVFGLMERGGAPVAPHISCVGDAPDAIRDLLAEYQERGVRRVVALRGDLPSGVGLSRGDMRYATDLVVFIRDQFGDHFEIEVAAYPEVHPEAPDLEVDLQNFQRKVEAGADSALTQYFFNPDAYFRFVDRCKASGITVPIVPGIMPITNYTRLARFSDACGAEIPRWIRKQLQAYGDDLDSIRAFGEEVVTRLCERLLAGGAPGIHFYTLNQAGPSLAIWQNLGLSARRANG